MGQRAVLEQCLSKSAILSSYQMRERTLRLEEVISVLNAARISFVLVGAHGLAGWRKKPRAKEDVDVVVANRQVRKAVSALLEAFPHLEEVDLPVVVRLRDRTTHAVSVDVMNPMQQPYREVFKNTRSIDMEGERVRIPTLEMAIVMKFAAMTSLYRADEDKYLDAHDFISIVKNNSEFDASEVDRLASLIYPEGGKDCLDLTRKALAGEKLNI